MQWQVSILDEAVRVHSSNSVFPKQVAKAVAESYDAEPKRLLPVELSHDKAQRRIVAFRRLARMQRQDIGNRPDSLPCLSALMVTMTWFGFAGKWPVNCPDKCASICRKSR